MSTRRRADDDVPVLTEIVDIGVGVSPIAPDVAEAIAREVEQAVLARLGDDLDRMVEQRLARTLGEFLDTTRADLSESVRKIVREAVTGALAGALAARTGPGPRRDPEG